jgi:uncharacterized protein with PQ loop repeat
VVASASQIIGLAATLWGVGAAGAVLLQARQMLERGSSYDVSVRFFAVYVGGYGIWLIYGVSIGSVPIIVVDAVGLVLGTFTLAVALALRGSLVRPATWGRCPPVEVTRGGTGRDPGDR